MAEQQNYNGQPKKNESTQDWKEKFNSEWITQGATPQMVTFAEQQGRYMATAKTERGGDSKLTSSQFRNIYGELKRIQMGGYDANSSSFCLLRPKVAYAYGRSNGNMGLKRFKEIFDLAVKSVSDAKTFNNFCMFMEAIIAYHRANGGK